jgi:hypothetical protein
VCVNCCYFAGTSYSKIGEVLITFSTKKESDNKHFLATAAAKIFARISFQPQ